MPRVKLFNEEDVLQKTIDLFWRKGYSATSIQDLVDFLGINRASLYDTFGGKKELFEKAFKRYKEANKNVIVNFLKNQSSVKNGLLKLFELHINASVCESGVRGCFIVNTTTELVPEDAVVHSILVENKNELEKIFYDYLKKGVEKGEITKNKDLKLISSFLFTLLNGIMVTAKVKPNKKDLLSTVKTGLSVLD